MGDFLIKPESDESNVSVSQGALTPLPATEIDTPPFAELAVQSEVGPTATSVTIPASIRVSDNTCQYSSQGQ